MNLKAIWMVSGDSDYLLAWQENKPSLHPFLCQELLRANSGLTIHCFKTIVDGVKDFVDQQKVSATLPTPDDAKETNEEQKSLRPLDWNVNHAGYAAAIVAAERYRKQMEATLRAIGVPEFALFAQNTLRQAQEAANVLKHAGLLEHVRQAQQGAQILKDSGVLETITQFQKQADELNRNVRGLTGDG